MEPSNRSLRIRLRKILFAVPLKRRIDGLNSLFGDSSLIELQFVLPIVINCIFNVSASYGPGWNIRAILRHKNVEDFKAAVVFLHPQGSVMNVIYKLLKDSLLKYQMYDYPLTHVPESFIHQIKQGSLPRYFTDKLIWQPHNQTSVFLSLNLYELFLYHFIFQLVAPWQTGPKQPKSNKPLDSVYLALFDLYLNHLFPINNSVIFPEIYLQKTTRHWTPQVQHVSQFFGQSTLDITTQSVIVEPHKEIWRSNTFLNVFIQFWLVIIERKKFLPPDDYADRAAEQLQAILSMIKHMHFFANNIRNDNSALDELRKNIRTMLKPYLHNFLLYRIQHCPLDNSFRFVLDTYLTYIQPWRYFNYDLRPIEKSRNVESRWIPFISENLSAYTVFSRKILKRFYRTDLSCCRNALMIFRLVTVLKEPHLPDFLKKLCTKAQHDQTLNLFNADTKKIVQELMIHMQRITSRLKTVEAVQLLNAQPKSFYEKIYKQLLLKNEQNIIDEIKKTIGYLNESMESLEKIFNVKPPNNNCIPENVSKLSSIKRFITPEESRLRVKKLKYEGHPDLLPIQSYEITSWVRALHRFSTVLNQQYGAVFNEMWHRDDLLSRIARRSGLLAPPYQYFYFDKSNRGQPAPRVAQNLPPRVCLRPLAQRRVAIFLLSLLLLLSFIKLY